MVNLEIIWANSFKLLSLPQSYQLVASQFFYLRSKSFLDLKVIVSVKKTDAMYKPPKFLRSRIVEDPKYANMLLTRRTKLMGLSPEGGFPYGTDGDARRKFWI